MSNEPASPEGNPAPAAPPAPNPEPAPSTPPAPKSDIERLRESKDEWKTKALEAEKRLQEKETAEKQKQEEEMKAKEQYKDLLDTREKELADERAKREAYEKRVQEIEAAQEAEIVELLKEIPEDKQPPLDSTDSPAKRLQQVKYAKSLLSTGPKPPVGAGIKPDAGDNKGRRKELLDAEKQRPLTEEESFELMGLGEE